ncbi:MAG: esterase-like activity of phytase family protein [Phycisphaerales bacterium]|nr:esterase-like activity of phytase family protein [Phycisphaerales bacterium]
MCSRLLIRIGVASLIGAGFFPPLIEAQTLSVVGRNSVNLPTTTTDQHGAMFTIAGLSGITFRGTGAASGSGGEFIAAMDNSNRLVRLQVGFDANAGIASVAVIGGLTLAESHDHEGIAYTGAAADSVFLSEEEGPAIREFSLADGSLIRTVTVPAVFANRRANFGFESLSLGNPDGNLWTANEEALSVDGPISSSANGSLVRLQRFSRGLLAADGQYAYLTEPWHGGSLSGARSGVSDLVVLPNGRVLALERSLAFNLAGLFQSRIYEIDFAGATDTSTSPGLPAHPFTAVTKRALWTGNANNLEGLCLGPRVATNAYALVGVVDDGDPISINSVVAFALSGGVCAADTDRDGVVSIQDLFDFLALYFAGSSAADINSSDNLTVQDIFDYLTAYFSGC